MHENESQTHLTAGQREWWAPATAGRAMGHKDPFGCVVLWVGSEHKNLHQLILLIRLNPPLHSRMEKQQLPGCKMLGFRIAPSTHSLPNCLLQCQPDCCSPSIFPEFQHFKDMYKTLLIVKYIGRQGSVSVEKNQVGEGCPLIACIVL